MISEFSCVHLVLNFVTQAPTNIKFISDRIMSNFYNFTNQNFLTKSKKSSGVVIIFGWTEKFLGNRLG